MLTRGTLGGLALTVVVVAGIFFARNALRGPVGAHCADDGDCRSGFCLKDFSLSWLAGGKEHESVCSGACESDADCPAFMACGAVSGGGSIWHGCVHRELSAPGR